MGFFYELELGQLPIYDDDGKKHGSVPVANYDPIVYGVSVDRKPDHGQAIACACCETPGGEGSRHRK